MKPKTRRRVQKEEACYGWSTFCELERKRVRSLVAARRHWVSKSPNGAPLAAAASGAHFPFFEDPPQHLYATGSLDNKWSLLKKNCNGITVISIQQSPIYKKEVHFLSFLLRSIGSADLKWQHKEDWTMMSKQPLFDSLDEGKGPHKLLLFSVYGIDICHVTCLQSVCCSFPTKGLYQATCWMESK